MAQLDTIANYAEIIGALLVVGGLGFAVLELRRARESRNREAAYEIFNNLSSREFIQGLDLLTNLPEGMTKSDIDALPSHEYQDLRWVMHQFEHLGTMVYNGMVPLELAMNFYYVSILNTWNKLQAYILEMRQITGKPNYMIYVQRLAEDIAALNPENIGMGGKRG